MIAAARPAFTRLSARLTGLRRRAASAPLAVNDLRDLTRLAADIGACVTVVTRDLATLVDSRGLTLEDTRRLFDEIATVAADLPMLVVIELRRAGHIRNAARAYWQFVRAAPHDARWHDHLAGFGHFLEQYGDSRGGRMCRSLAAALIEAWWRDPMAVEWVNDGLAQLAIDWDRLPQPV